MISKNFLWGGAISACQSEGAYLEDGRTQSVFDTLPLPENGRWDIYKNPNLALNQTFDYYPSHTGIDFYHTYKEDLKLLSDLGIKCFRTSISWSRIFPTLEGPINEKGIQFYIDLFTECRKYGIEPLVTLSHFDTPLYLVDDFDGWKSKETLEKFKVYASFVMDSLKDLVHLWIPINEINMILHIPYLGGGMVSLEEKDKHQAAHNMLCASAYVVKKAKELSENHQVGCMLAAGIYYPYTSNPLDVVAAQKENRNAYLFTDVQMRGAYPTWFLKQTQAEITEDEIELIKSYTADFVAISYYTTRLTAGTEVEDEGIDGNSAKTLRNKYLEITPWGRQIDPVGLKSTLIDLYDRYLKPIFIVENGLGVEDTIVDDRVDDDYRIDFMNQHIAVIGEAITEGVEVMGYLTWGIIDVISAGGGEMNKRYGLIYVDLDNYGEGTAKRVPKKSYYWFKERISG